MALGGSVGSGGFVGQTDKPWLVMVPQLYSIHLYGTSTVHPRARQGCLTAAVLCALRRHGACCMYVE